MSFLQEVLTAHELDELGLNEAIRSIDVQPPRALNRKEFLDLRSKVVFAMAMDVCITGLITYSHATQWTTIDKVIENMTPNMVAILTLTCSVTYAFVITIVELWKCAALRRQLGNSSIDVRLWDLVTCGNTLLSRLQNVLDTILVAECHHDGRKILAGCAILVLVMFHAFPRLILSLNLTCHLYQPSAPKYSVIDFVGNIVGVPSRKRSMSLSSSVWASLQNLKSVVAPHAATTVNPNCKLQSSRRPDGTWRRSALGTSYTSIIYSLLKAVCLLRQLTQKVNQLYSSFSLSRKCWTSVARSLREVRHPAEISDDPAMPLSQAQSLSPHPSMEVELESRSTATVALRRSRGLVPNGTEAEWLAEVASHQIVLDDSPPTEIGTLDEARTFQTRSDFGGWRYQVVGDIEDGDFFTKMWKTINHIEITTATEDAKVVELSALALVGDYYLTQDVLKEEFVPVDCKEELEFLASLFLFLRLHGLNCILNLLRFHCLMTSVRNGVDWFLILAILTSLAHAMIFFLYVAFDQAVIDEFMDDD